MEFDTSKYKYNVQVQTSIEAIEDFCLFLEESGIKEIRFISSIDFYSKNELLTVLGIRDNQFLVTSNNINDEYTLDFSLFNLRELKDISYILWGTLTKLTDLIFFKDSNNWYHIAKDNELILKTVSREKYYKEIIKHIKLE